MAPKEALTPEATEIKATPADAEWLLKIVPGDMAKNLDDLLLVCEYAVDS